MIIADSSALISLLVPTDTNHSLAIKISTQFQHRADTIILPGDIFSELINIIGKKFNHQKAYEAATFLLNNKIFFIENITEQLRQNALDLFQKQPDSVSFTDCIVMVLAEHFETKEIFGFDEAFHKNGYIRLGVDNK